MAELADLLMLSGMLRDCPDCAAETLVVPTDSDGCYCCTTCGAALLIDPALDAAADGRRTVAA